MSRVKVFTKLFVVLSLVFSMLFATDSPLSARSNALHPLHNVSLNAPYGYSSGKIRARLSDSEWRISKKLEPLTRLPEVIENLPIDNISWRIEDSATNSETLRLGIRALQDVRKLFVLLGVPEDSFTIIVARTQKFIKSQLSSLNCSPNAELTKGVFVMGAAVCNYKIIVMNLTGYFFYRYAGQTITSAMEKRPEPAMRNFSYLRADRNISGLSHEWIHVMRGQMAQGYVPPDEPAWFREGFAEIMAGIGRASSFNNKLNYVGFHVIRLRKFSVWPSRCALPLRSYRQNSKSVSGCEYLRGATAIELLLADHGGLEKVVSLYKDLVETNDFTESFRRIYGFSMSSFEKAADRYAGYINQAARFG